MMILNLVSDAFVLCGPVDTTFNDAMRRYAAEGYVPSGGPAITACSKCGEMHVAVTLVKQKPMFLHSLN